MCAGDTDLMEVAERILEECQENIFSFIISVVCLCQNGSKGSSVVVKPAIYDHIGIILWF